MKQVVRRGRYVIGGDRWIGGGKEQVLDWRGAGMKQLLSITWGSIRTGQIQITYNKTMEQPNFSLLFLTELYLFH